MNSSFKLLALALVVLAWPERASAAGSAAGPSAAGILGILLILLLLCAVLAWIKKNRGAIFMKLSAPGNQIQIKSAQHLPLGDRAYVLSAEGVNVLVVVSKTGQVSSTPLPSALLDKPNSP